MKPEKMVWFLFFDIFILFNEEDDGKNLARPARVRTGLTVDLKRAALPESRGLSRLNDGWLAGCCWMDHCPGRVPPLFGLDFSSWLVANVIFATSSTVLFAQWLLRRQGHIPPLCQWLWPGSGNAAAQPGWTLPLPPDRQSPTVSRQILTGRGDSP